jgi:hypothetical protein
MKKRNLLDIVLYFIVGFVFLIGYYLLMTEYFKINPFKGYYIIITSYILICSILFPFTGQLVSEIFDKNRFLDEFTIPQFQLTIAYIFAPFILLLSLFIGKK